MLTIQYSDPPGKYVYKLTPSSKRKAMLQMWGHEKKILGELVFFFFLLCLLNEKHKTYI